LKTLLLVVGLLSLHSTSFAHKYYFGFAEVEYDFFTQRFEATLTVTAHDLELALSKKGGPEFDLESSDSLQSITIENYINDNFAIQSGESKCTFKLVGQETELNGNVNFYLESTEIAIKNTITVEFKILMGYYKEQQNKITLYYKEKPYTLAFTRGEQKQTIQLENNEE
jgi:Domain of unknown function (DUF6702)